CTLVGRNLNSHFPLQEIGVTPDSPIVIGLVVTIKRIVSSTKEGFL
ncbi:MAG: hypothetical protein QOD33_1258, partial [Pyrinomonadaceae bacterium]|nr:hypothetical protein [Pyrinomonadaceae bacterium]